MNSTNVVFPPSLFSSQYNRNYYSRTLKCFPVCIEHAGSNSCPGAESITVKVETPLSDALCYAQFFPVKYKQVITVGTFINASDLDSFTYDGKNCDRPLTKGKCVSPGKFEFKRVGKGWFYNSDVYMDVVRPHSHHVFRVWVFERVDDTRLRLVSSTPSERFRIHDTDADDPRRRLRSIHRRQRSSVFKGVSLCKEYGSVKVRIHVEGKDVYVGKFRDEFQAAMAYDVAAAKHGLNYMNFAGVSSELLDELYERFKSNGNRVTPEIMEHITPFKQSRKQLM